LEDLTMQPATDWKEKVAPGEGALFESFAERLHALQRQRAVGGQASRALHTKGQLGLEAELEVLPDLPEPARVALFARPAKYRAYVRFSNGAGRRQSDHAGDVRGVALKLVGVAGKKVIPGLESAVTQDFLMIRTPVTPFRNAAEFVPVLMGAMTPPFGILRAGLQVGFGRLFQILRATLRGFKVPTLSLATTRYFSASPIRFGAYAVHYALRPHAQPDPNAKVGPSAEYLSEELSARLKEGPVVYDFQVQFFVDETRTPIEDASVEWKEADAPFVTVARLTIPKQDPTSERGRKLAALVEGFSFDPWHAVEELRPLGDMMRARNVAYRVSTGERKAAAEPDGTEALG
jgi:catalase